MAKVLLYAFVEVGPPALPLDHLIIGVGHLAAGAAEMKSHYLMMMRGSPLDWSEQSDSCVTGL